MPSDTRPPVDLRHRTRASDARRKAVAEEDATRIHLAIREAGRECAQLLLSEDLPFRPTDAFGRYAVVP